MTYLVQWGGESYHYFYDEEFSSLEEVEQWYKKMVMFGCKMQEGWEHGREGHWYEVSGRIDFTEHLKSKDMRNEFDPLN